MIKAKVEWRRGSIFLNYLETGEAIIYSNPKYGGDMGLRWFPDFFTALRALGWKDTDDVDREFGYGEFDESFVEQLRSASAKKFLLPMGHA